MLNKKVAKLINEQVNKEMYSAYLYLDFANYFEDEGLDGFANWYTIQAQEEMEHAMKMRKYLIDNGVRVELEAIGKPDKVIKAPLDAVKAGLVHEQYVTGLINAIYDAAWEVKEYKTMQFLDWFVKEQVEEEKNAEELLNKVETFAKELPGLYALNQELKGRKAD